MDNNGVDPERFAPEPIVSQMGDIPDREYAPFFFSEDKPRLTVEMTNDELQQVIAALRNGAYMTYGDDGTAVFWAFLKNVQYPIVGGDMSCDDIADCIDSDENVQDTIVDMLEGNEDFRDNIVQIITEHSDGSEFQKNTPIDPEFRLTITQPECDLDVLYGQCLGIVQTANRLIEDFLQQWETYTNSGEVVSDLVNSVPLLAELANASGMSGILEYANDLVDSVAENYLSDYDLEYEDALACELFCAAQTNDCNLTIQMTCDILNTRIGNALTLSNLTEFIVSLTDQDISGFNVADLYMAFFFNAMQIGNIVLPLSFGIDQWFNVISAFNEANDDWTTVCETCPEIVCYDLRVGLYGWYACNAFATPDAYWGLWYDGEGIGPGAADQAFFWRHAAGAISGVAQAITLTFNTSPGSIFIRAGNGTMYEIAVSGTSIEFNEDNMPDLFPYNSSSDSFDITFTANHAPSDSFRVTRMCYELVP